MVGKVCVHEPVHQPDHAAVTESSYIRNESHYSASDESSELIGQLTGRSSEVGGLYGQVDGLNRSLSSRPD